MVQLKAGDNVRLTKDLTLGEGKLILPKGTKGQVFSVHTETGYTVVFEGDITPAADLSDHDIELDVE